ncbi:MAG: MaoC family dehydratase N-terminal domain-containing protein [Proteobacteria bacterium]|nr:MaoC family dehydratase N-terminal domain-containing protein [Pseudomonadota bacterium]
MAINLELVGKKSDPEPFKYDQYRVILYALGIGAEVDQELDFVYEKNLKVFPTFAVIPMTPGMGALMGNLNLNWTAVLHGEQKIVLHKPIPPAGTLMLQGGVESVYDKGDNGAVVNISGQARDESGDLVYETAIVLMDRAGGNFGGDRGPKTEKIAPPEGQTPDFKVDYKTSDDQAALYRLSGDKNPLHVDPDFAAMGGFKKPILHGLCTYGHTGRAILHSICESDPARFKSLAARFTGVVFPGDTLTIEGWKAGEGRYVIQTKTQDGRMVLGNALAEVA